MAKFFDPISGEVRELNFHIGRRPVKEEPLQVGDTVEMLEPLPGSPAFNGWWIRSLQFYVGKTDVICQIGSDGVAQLAVCRFWWGMDCLKRVPKP